MAIQPLNCSYLNTMSVARMKLTEADPVDVLKLGDHDELLVYPLLGKVNLATWNDAGLGVMKLGTFGTNRCNVLTPLEAVFRWSPTSYLKSAVHFTLTDGYIADFLIVVHRPPEIPPLRALFNPIIQVGDIYTHLVEEGKTDERHVTEIRPPEGFAIECGETLNIPGGWSSFPAHADPEIAQTRYAEHEEVFFVITPERGFIVFDGYYCTGERAIGVHQVDNGMFIATPLGSHPIVFMPNAWGYYAWFYVSTAIQKTYNRFADECGLRAYVS